MASTTVTRRSPRAWIRIAFAMFAVGWGANQFSPMLIVYRHELRLTTGEVAGLFLVYALTLIPGLLIGGPVSDRLGQGRTRHRRPAEQRKEHLRAVPVGHQGGHRGQVGVRVHDPHSNERTVK